MIKGTIGGNEFEFDRPLTGRAGYARFRMRVSPQGPSSAGGGGAGAWTEFRWERAADGIAIEVSNRDHSIERHHYTVETTLGEDGFREYRVYDPSTSREWSGLRFARAGVPGTGLANGGPSSAAGTGGGRKPIRLKAQMPGRIVRILHVPGDAVEKDQPVLVMEAMKMENEIRAPHAGRVAKLAVQEGQAVETGAELVTIEATP